MVNTKEILSLTMESVMLLRHMNYYYLNNIRNLLVSKLVGYIKHWRRITGDKEVLKTISVMKLEFENEPPENNSYLYNLFYEQHFFPQRKKIQFKLKSKNYFLKKSLKNVNMK